MTSIIYDNDSYFTLLLGLTHISDVTSIIYDNDSYFTLLLGLTHRRDVTSIICDNDSYFTSLLDSHTEVTITGYDNKSYLNYFHRRRFILIMMTSVVKISKINSLQVKVSTCTFYSK